MSRFFRFLSRRRTGRGVKHKDSDHPKKHKHHITCTVMLLDGTDFTVDIHVSMISFILLWILLFSGNSPGIWRFQGQTPVYSTPEHWDFCYDFRILFDWCIVNVCSWLDIFRETKSTKIVPWTSTVCLMIEWLLKKW